VRKPGLLRDGLARDDVWCLIAEEDGALAGHVAIMDATRHQRFPAEPGTAHLWQLFVRAPWWGSGLATQLLAAAVDEARARGYARMRLVTPAGQARARRFYEREGWSAGEPFDDRELGLAIVEYRRDV
jgi:GNAT superfamily N-acetyltransferase